MAIIAVVSYIPTFGGVAIFIYIYIYLFISCYARFSSFFVEIHLQPPCHASIVGMCSPQASPYWPCCGLSRTGPCRPSRHPRTAGMPAEMPAEASMRCECWSCYSIFGAEALRMCVVDSVFFLASPQTFW